MNAIGNLNDLGLTPADAVVIGSGILGALGIRESNDIDLVVTEAAFARLGQDCRFKKRQSHGREELAADLGEVGTCWTVLDRNWTFDDLCDVSVVIDGVRYITPEFLLAAKRSWLKPAGKPKDFEDAESIERYLAMHGAEVEAMGVAIPAMHLAALRLIGERLDEAPPVWAVTGSLAFALRGMDLVVHDIDLQSDRAGAYEIERRLSEFVVEPVHFSEAERVRSHFGALRVSGVRVEIMGDIEKRTAGSVWESPADLTAARQWITAHGQRVPVLSLEHEYRAYRALGRTQRADMLKRWMERE